MDQEDTLKEKTLEQLAQKLRKLLPREYHTWVKELVSRAHVAYVQALDSELASNEVLCADDKTAFGFRSKKNGWFPLSEITSIGPERVLLFFPYNKENTLECFSPKYERTDIPAGSVFYCPQGGYEILACNKYSGFYMRAWDHTLTKEIAIPLDVSGATHFKAFAGTASHVTRDGVIESNRRLRAQVQQFKEALEAKNTELDALGYVWCTGGCAGGQHRYTEPKEITSDMIARLVGVVLRIYARGANTGVIDERKNQWQTQRITRAFSRIAKVGENRIDFLSKMVDDFRDGTNMERHVENLSVVTYMKNNDDITPNVSGMLAELLAKRIVVVDAFNKLCLQGDEWFNKTLYPIELSDIKDIHEAATKEGGLWVWVIENHKTTNKPCGHVVTQLKTLGLWKTDWGNLK
jgi:hypothetical protein